MINQRYAMLKLYSFMERVGYATWILFKAIWIIVIMYMILSQFWIGVRNTFESRGEARMRRANMEIWKIQNPTEWQKVKSHLGIEMRSEAK